MTYLAAFCIWDVTAMISLSAVVLALIMIRRLQIREEERLEEELANEWAEDAVWRGRESGSV